MKGQTEIPDTSDQLEEMLLDDGRMNDILAGGQWAEFTQKYVTAAMDNKRAELGTQMREQLQLGMQQFLQAQADGGYSPAAGFRPGSATMTKRDARMTKAIARARRRLPDADYQAEKQCLFGGSAMASSFDEEGYAQSMRSFMYTMWKAEKHAQDRGDDETPAKVQAYKRALHAALTHGRPSNAGMAERIPSEGGFLVPEVLRSEILMVALEQSVVRPRARVIQMDSLRVPLPIVDDTTHTASVYGGVAAYWTAEGAPLSATAPKWGRVDLEARKLTAFTTIPNELLQDSITPLDQWFNLFFPRALAYFEDVAFISGGGVGEPQGFLNSPCAVSVPVGSDNVIVWADIAKAYSRMWPPSLNSAVWLCAPDVLVQLLQLSVSSNVSPPLWLSQFQGLATPGGGNGDGVHYTLMGRPLIVTEKMPSCSSGNTTTPGALTFVDLDQYLLGDRQSMQIATSEEYLFASDLVAYRVIERLDGRIWQQSAITPQNGSTNTLSPVVKIDTTATS